MPTGVRISILLAALACAWAQEPKRPPITGVAHVALYTKDVEASRRFYKDFLGYGEPFDLKNSNGSLALTFIKINDRQYVELFPETAPNTDRLNHISIETTDAEAMRKYLASKGITVPAAVPKGRIGNSNFNVKDPDGHTVEIVQYESAGWSAREKGKFMGPQRISTNMIHAGILVGATEAAMRFYRDTLGFVETWRGSRDNVTLSWINLRVPDGTDYVEFMLYSELPEPTKRGTQHHICLVVPDMDRARSELMVRREKAGYTQPLEIRTGINRKRQMNLYDPDGTRIELMEPDTVDRVPAPSSKAPPPQVQTATRDWQPPPEEVRQKPVSSCTGLRRLTGVEFTVITAVDYAPTASVPAYCRVTGQVQPEIRFEVNLPLDWNRRLLMSGNGGYAGDEVDNPLRPGGQTALPAGFVTARTNTGHDAAREPLGTFAVNSQKLFDYAFRAVHVTAQTAKQIAAAYYGRAPERSYFIGCSTGGRQALMSAQRFPGDFDGILAGAPVLDFTGTVSKYASWVQAQGNSAFPVTKMKLLADKIYAQCDAKDGLADGLITDPRDCGFQPARDLPKCAAENGAACFTSGEIKSLESMYGDLHMAGRRVFPGWPVGAEIAGQNAQSGWYRWIVNDQGPTIGQAFAETFFRYATSPFRRKTRPYSCSSWI